MVIKITHIFSFILLFQLLGCKTKGEFTKLDAPREIIKIAGVSLLSPSGDNWYYKKTTPGKLIFGKSGNSKDQTLTGMVVLSKLPPLKSKETFLELVSKQRSRKLNTTRFKNIFNKEIISDEKNVWGVRFHIIYKDYGAKNLPQKSSFLIVEDIGIVCQHPYNKNVAVTIALSQRTKEHHQIANFKLLADTFIKNAKFIPFSKNKTRQ